MTLALYAHMNKIKIRKTDCGVQNQECLVITVNLQIGLLWTTNGILPNVN
jgi:hypothetical protein